MHHEHNSPPKSSSPNRNNGPPFVKLRKKLANVSTNTGEYKCPKCEEREELLSLGDNDELKVNYIKALNYINSCHGIMNELLGPKGFLGGKRSNEVIMPELPNFLDIFGAMQKGLSSQSSSQSSRRSSKTLINPFVNDTGDITARLEHSNNDIAEEPDKEESENLEIKVKRSFIELVPDIKQLDEFKKIDDESLPKSWSNAETTDSDNSLEKSGKNFIEMNIIKAKEARIRTREQKLPISKSDRLEFCGSKARNNERYKESEDNQTVEKSKSDDGVKIETLMPEAPKEINLHSYEPNPERVQRRIKDDKGKNSDTKDDVFDRYAKELLESSEGSTQITPRKGSVSPQRKVKFSEQLVSISKDSQPKFDSSKDSITGSTHRVTSVNCRSARQSKSPSPKSSCANELNVLRANDNSSMNTQASHLPKCMHACTLKQIQQMAFTKRKLNVEKPLDKAGAFRFGCGESSDTDYIPSDSESEKAMANLKSVERSKTEEPVSHPLKLSQRNLHSVDGNVVVNMGLFNKNGQLPKEVIKILEDEKTNRAKDARNKPFRTMRTLHEEKTIDRSDFIKLKQVGSDSSSEYSDVDSELVMQDIVEEEIQKKNQQTIKAKLSTSRQKTS